MSCKTKLIMEPTTQRSLDVLVATNNKCFPSTSFDEDEVGLSHE